MNRARVRFLRYADFVNRKRQTHEIEGKLSWSTTLRPLWQFRTLKSVPHVPILTMTQIHMTSDMFVCKSKTCIDHDQMLLAGLRSLPQKNAQAMPKTHVALVIHASTPS
jgi:hypothetical protein